MVEDSGFEAIEAASAEEAVRILESRKDIRIVFTDINMPESMDGMKLAACIRDRWPPVEIILTSGAAKDIKVPERGLFFPKPYDPEVVSQAMRWMASADLRSCRGEPLLPVLVKRHFALRRA